MRALLDYFINILFSFVSYIHPTHFDNVLLLLSSLIINKLF